MLIAVSAISVSEGVCGPYDAELQRIRLGADQPSLAATFGDMVSDPCGVAARSSAELKELEAALPGKKEIAAETVVSYEAAAAAKNAAAEDKRKFLSAHPEFAASPKYTSYFEIDAKKKAIIDRLEKDAAAYSNVNAMLSSEGAASAYECSKFAERKMRNECISARNKTFDKVRDVFSKRAALAKKLKLCIIINKIPGSCRSTVISSDNCPLTAKSLLKLSTPADIFDSYNIDNGLLNTGGDICATGKKEYLALIDDYERNKNSAVESAVKKETPGEKSNKIAFAGLDGALTTAAYREEQAKKKNAEAKDLLAQMEKRKKELTAGIKDNTTKCADARCSPEITRPGYIREYSIDIVPQMPIVTAAGLPAGGEWAFNVAWSYKRVVCNYPPEAAQKTAGGSFDSSVYNNEKKIFGGNVHLTYTVDCPKGKVSAVYDGKITGTEPGTPQVHDEIRSRLESLNVNNSNINKENEAKAKGKEVKDKKITLDETSDLKILEQIVCQESRYHQFSPSGTGFPYATNEMDIGLFQVRTVSTVEDHCDVAWNWRHNVRRGVEIYAQKSKDALGHNRSEVNPAYGNNIELQRCIRNQMDAFMLENLLTDDESKISEFSELVSSAVCKQRGVANMGALLKLLDEKSFKALTVLISKLKGIPPPLTPSPDDEDASVTQLQREAIRRYNGGREHKFEIDEEKRDSCGGDWGVFPKTKPENIKYVDEVLSRKVDCPDK